MNWRRVKNRLDANKARTSVYTLLFIQLPFTVMLHFLNGAYFQPSPTTFVKQKEWISTMIMEDEFTDPTNHVDKDYARNALEAESVDDIWQWTENILLPTLKPVCIGSQQRTSRRRQLPLPLHQCHIP